MKTLEYIRWADPPLWKATFANILPLWLLSLMFLPSPISGKLAGILFMLTIAVIIFLLWIRWFTPELILYSLFPIIPIMIFEEVPASYKIPFILFCALLLSIGIFGYQLSFHKGFVGLAWLILLVVFIGTWILASHANQNYWQMTDNATPWWILFFRS